MSAVSVLRSPSTGTTSTVYTGTPVYTVRYSCTMNRSIHRTALGRCLPQIRGRIRLSAEFLQNGTIRVPDIMYMYRYLIQVGTKYLIIPPITFPSGSAYPAGSPRLVRGGWRGSNVVSAKAT